MPFFLRSTFSSFTHSSSEKPSKVPVMSSFFTAFCPSRLAASIAIIPATVFASTILRLPKRHLNNNPSIPFIDFSLSCLKYVLIPARSSISKGDESFPAITYIAALYNRTIKIPAIMPIAINLTGSPFKSSASFSSFSPRTASFALTYASSSAERSSSSAAIRS